MRAVREAQARQRVASRDILPLQRIPRSHEFFSLLVLQYSKSIENRICLGAAKAVGVPKAGNDVSPEP